MTTISLTGATGFIGQHLLRRLAQRPGVDIRALTHGTPQEALLRLPGVEWMRGDLLDRATIDALLAPGCDVVHLAFPERWTREQQIAANANLAQRAIELPVRRVVHCSTAVVVGKTREHAVNEQTRPEPVTEYEVTKLEIEHIWRERCRNCVDLAILRPTAVFGPGGRNLIKLANALLSGNPITNYLRSSLFGRRQMNLVPVESVVAAFEFVLGLSSPLRGEVFLVSADDDPRNNFREIEKLLRTTMHVPDYPIPLLTMPSGLLAAALRLAGHSNCDPKRIYEAEKLKRTGFPDQPGAFERTLREFAAWFVAKQTAAGVDAA